MAQLATAIDLRKDLAVDALRNTIGFIQGKAQGNAGLRTAFTYTMLPASAAPPQKITVTGIYTPVHTGLPASAGTRYSIITWRLKRMSTSAAVHWRNIVAPPISAS